MPRLNRRHVYLDNVAPSSGMKARAHVKSYRHTRARGRHPISMRGKWHLMCVLDFFNMETLLQLLLTQKLISSKCALFKNNFLPSDTVPLSYVRMEFCSLATYGMVFLLGQSWLSESGIVGKMTSDVTNIANLT